MIAGRLVVLSGPTASGKSSLALALAREFPLEIVNADSLQVYRRFDIGTAKPTVAERGEVPHHLIDVADPDEPYDAGRYVRDAERAIGEIRARGKHPMLVGGTGMYIRALLRGLDPLPSDARVRRGALAALGSGRRRGAPRCACAHRPGNVRERPSLRPAPGPARARDRRGNRDPPQPGACVLELRGMRGTGACSLPFGRTGTRCTGGSTPGRRRCSGEGWWTRSGDCSQGGSTGRSSR